MMIKFGGKKRILALGIAFSLLGSTAAMAAGTMPIDLKTAIERAFATHADIKKAEYNLDSARASWNAARESYGPTVALTHSTGRGGYWEDQGLGIGKSIDNSYSNTVSLSVPIYSGGQLEGAEKRARANYQSYVLGEELAYINLKKTTTDAYYTLLAAKDSVNVSEQSVATLEDHLKNVQAQYDVGVVAKVDLLRSEVELTSAEQTRIKAQNAYDLAEANLDNIMGIPQDTHLEPQETLQYTPYDVTLDDAIAYALANRMDLQQSKLQVDAAEAALTIAKAGYRPYISGRAANNWTQGHWPGDDKENWALGLNMSMTFFDSGVVRSKVNAAKADLMTAEESYRSDVDTVRLDVRSCYYDLREAEKRISTTQVAVAKAEEDYHIAQVRYENGVGTNTDVMDAQVALVTARNNFNTALYDYNTAKNALQTAMGIEARPTEYSTFVTKPKRVEATDERYDNALDATEAERNVKDKVKKLEKARREAKKAAEALEKAEKETREAEKNAVKVRAKAREKAEKEAEEAAREAAKDAAEEAVEKTAEAAAEKA